MSPLYQVLCVSLVIINAQNEEIFYHYDCEQQLDWIQDVGSYNPDLGHTYKPIQWRLGSSRCPRAAAGETSTDATRCVQTTYDASISRIISTTGFHSIRLQIDAKADGVDTYEDEWCTIEYRTATTNWIKVNIAQGDDYVLDYDVFISDNDEYGNQQSFEVKMGIAGDAGGDNCYFDNLKVFGIPYTETPTLDTNHPTKNPSRAPSFEPTKHPSNGPTEQPTFSPSADPTTVPTFPPSVDPTTEPTFLPSTDPTTAPAFSPSTDPTTASFLSAVIAPTIAILSPSTQNTFDFTEEPEETDNVFISKLKTNDDTLITIVIVTIISIAVLCIIRILVHCKQSKQRKKIYVIDRNIAMNNLNDMGHKVNKNDNYIRESMNEEPKVNIDNVDNEELRSWLNIMELRQYYSCFVEHGYDTLSSIKNCIGDKAELEAIGIYHMGHRNRILAAIKILQNEGASNDVTKGTVATTGEMTGGTKREWKTMTNHHKGEVSVEDIELEDEGQPQQKEHSVSSEELYGSGKNDEIIKTPMGKVIQTKGTTNMCSKRQVIQTKGTTNTRSHNGETVETNAFPNK